MTAESAPGDARPLIAHVVFRFDTGGLENGLVNLINHLPTEAYRHAVIALTEVTDFKQRVRRPDVQFFALHKPPGHGFRIYPVLWRLLRELKPAVLHTRNLAPLEMQAVAALAGVPVRIHGEHGRDVGDLDGHNVRLQRARRLYALFVQQWIALSRDLESYLVERVGIAPKKITQIYNGVDAQKFHPAPAGRESIAGCPFTAPGLCVLGTVGRMQAVKDQTHLARAFVRALERQPALRERLRLVMMGEGPLRAQAQAILDQAGASALAWLPGERSDVAAVMRGLDAFVLPSLGEGISNTILEAMASGLPVIATRVGGNAELVEDGRSGRLVPAADVDAMAQALVQLATDPTTATAWGRAGRAEVERRFSMQAMVAAYQGVYQRALAGRGLASAAPGVADVMPRGSGAGASRAHGPNSPTI